MFKNKAEQNRNDEKNNQTGLTVKIHSNHVVMSCSLIRKQKQLSSR